MKRITAMLTVVLLSLSLSGIAFAADEAKSAREKKETAAEAKSVKKEKKKKAAEGKGAVKPEVKKDEVKPAAKRRKEVSGC